MFTEDPGLKEITANIDLPTRRAHTRFIVNSSARLILQGGRQTTSILEDISSGGGKVFTEEPLRAEDLLELELSCFFGERLSRKARVAWVKQFKGCWQAGLDFGFEKIDFLHSGVVL